MECIAEVEERINQFFRAPKAIIKVGIAGIRTFESFAKHANLFLVSFKNGSVGIFNLEKRKLEFCTEPGHSETIFDIKFKPNDRNILGTASYDGFIKIWNMRNMKVKATLSHIFKTDSGGTHETKAVLYGISWAPGDDNRIASVNANGEVNIWDYTKSKLLTTLQVAGQNSPIYRVDWHPTNPALLAVGSTDKAW
jgi:WD repeat-containing protein 17